ncbi:MAG: hypothetical protein ACTSVY_15290 [Candidatus Helarchaeota archaeon]
MGEEDRVKKIRNSLIDSHLKSLKKSILDKKFLKMGKKRKKRGGKKKNPKKIKVKSASWEQELRNPNFCKNLTSDIKDDDFKNKQFNQCMKDPPRFIEKRYKDELSSFGKTNQPKIEDLLECKKTEKIVNLMAKEKEGPEYAYQINYDEGIKRALSDLKKFKDKEIEPFKTKEKKRTQKKNEKDYFKLVESCLPTESHLIERIRVKPPKSEPSAGEGNFILRFLRSLLSSKKPQKLSQTKFRPSTVAVSHQYEHKMDKFNHEEHLEDKWEEEFFIKIKEEKRIKKKGV